MSLRRRLLLYLLLCAPAVWAAALVFSVQQARREVNEMFDTELIRLARQVETMLSAREGVPDGALPPPPSAGTPEAGESDVRDLAIAVWDSRGRRVVTDREGVMLPHRPAASGSVEERIDGEDWRTYYLRSPSGASLIATGQKAYEREELIVSLTLSQVLPWLVVLPVLMAVMAWAVGRALAPASRLVMEVGRREANDLRAIEDMRLPAELRPLVDAMNALFARIGEVLQRERRLTADAAHELRTPLAVLRAQWDVVRHTRHPVERMVNEAKFTAGLERMDRLVTQMLALSRVESLAGLSSVTEIAWPPIVEQAMSESLSLAERRHIELACEWPVAGSHPLPLIGDPNLLIVLLRNLLDNAVRYARAQSTVTLRFAEDRLEVDNDGPPLTPAQIDSLGERFHRFEGQAESGSGLGISIVRRIAALHRLELIYGACSDGNGVRATLRFASLPSSNSRPLARLEVSACALSRAAGGPLLAGRRRRSAGPAAAAPSMPFRDRGPPHPADGLRAGTPRRRSWGLCRPG